MLCGICVYFSIDWEPNLLWLSLTPALSLLIYKTRKQTHITPLLALFLAISTGFNASQIEAARIKTPLLDVPIKEASITGTLIRAEAVPNGSRLTLKNPEIRGIAKDESPHHVRIKTRTAYKDIPEAGSRLNVWGPIWPPSDPVAPHGYNFRKHAYYAQIGGSGISYIPPRHRPTQSSPPFFWDAFLISFEKARRALTLMAHKQLTSPLKDMTATLLSGNQSGISPPIMKDMRLSGLSHLLSISGIHVSMMALLVYVPLRFFLALIPWLALRLPIKKIAAFAAIIATSFYTILVGADAPTVRSALMTGIVFFAIISDRKAMSLRLVAMAAMAIMLITPSTSMGPSFQMSFAAVLTMIAAFERNINAKLKEGITFERPNWISTSWLSLRALILTSLVATAATAPFTLYHFQTFSFYGVIANMIAIPLTSFWVMPCLLLTYIAAPFGLAGPFIEGTGWGVGLIIELAHTVASWPYAQIPFPPMPEWVLICMVLGGLWLCLWRARWRYFGLIPLVLCLSYPFFYNAPTVYVASESPILGVKSEDGPFVVIGKRKINFTTSQWAQQIGWPETTYLPKLKDIEFGKDLSCTKTHCLLKEKGMTIALLAPPNKRNKHQQAICTNADIVIGHMNLSHCTNQIIIDKTVLRKRGAHSITFKDGAPYIKYVRQKSQRRPWSITP